MYYVQFSTISSYLRPRVIDDLELSTSSIYRCFYAYFLNVNVEKHVSHTKIPTHQYELAQS